MCNRRVFCYNFYKSKIINILNNIGFFLIDIYNSFKNQLYKIYCYNFYYLYRCYSISTVSECSRVYKPYYICVVNYDVRDNTTAKPPKNTSIVNENVVLTYRSGNFIKDAS